MMTHRRLITIYSIHQTLHWLATGLLVPILALLQLKKGLNLFQIGLSVAVLSVTVIAFELPTGGLADSIGRKKVYVCSLLVRLVGITTLLFANSFFLIALAFFFMGIARSLSSGAMDAWFVDEFYLIESKGSLQGALAIIGIFTPISLGIGSIVGGILPDTIGLVVARKSPFDIYSSNLLVIILVILIQIVFTTMVIKDHHSQQGRFDRKYGLRMLPQVLATSIKFGIQNRTVFMLLLSTAALGLSLSSLENFWQPQLKSILSANPKTWVFGLLSAGYFFAASLGNVVITPICRLFRYSYAKVLLMSRICMGVMWLLLALQTNVLGFSIFYIVVFLFNGLSSSPHAAILNEQIPKETRSTLLSLESLFLQLGGAIGSVIMGYISNMKSIDFAWYIGSAFLIVSSVFYLYMPRSNEQSTRQ